LKSAAITFENNPHTILGVLSALSSLCFLVGGINAGFGMPYFMAISSVMAHYAWQLKILDINDPKKCWNLFTANRYLGLLLTFSILIGKYYQ